jgi:ABC-type lipoprotein export system ATPase subunit
LCDAWRYALRIAQKSKGTNVTDITLSHLPRLRTVSAVGLLTLDAVSKSFQRGREQVVALDGVTLEVEKGEFVAMVGPSGSGKSTLLHLAGGLDQPDAGRVLLGERDLSTLSAGERATIRRREVGFVFQFFHLIPTLTLAENVELPLLLDGVRDKRGVVRVMLERMGLGGRADHLPGELSGGEMQRAAIARALVAEPELILADEPTGNLDTATGRTILDVLSEQVSDAGAALLMVTHDESAASRAGRVLHLRDGQLEAAPTKSAPARRATAPKKAAGKKAAATTKKARTATTRKTTTKS